MKHTTRLTAHSTHLDARTAEDLHDLIDIYPDFPKDGVLFRDVSPLLADAASFEAIVEALCRPYQPRRARPTTIVGIESRGFIFGAAMARRLDIGFVPIRKAGKLPGFTERVDYKLEYGTAELELQLGVLDGADRVVIVDDLLATGGTAAAAAHLVRRVGASILSFDVVIELQKLAGRKFLENGFISNVHALFTYE